MPSNDSRNASDGASWNHVGTNRIILQMLLELKRVILAFLGLSCSLMGRPSKTTVLEGRLLQASSCVLGPS